MMVVSEKNYHGQTGKESTMRYPEFQKQIKAFIEENRQAMLDDLASLIEIPSVVQDALPGKPYGADCYDALLRTEAIAKKLGFVTNIVDNAVLTAEYGDRPVQLSCMCHLDVVAAGDGWATPPYTMTCKDNILYGRGVSDDKGPAIAVLYAMKAVRELCPDLPFSPLVWLGTAEEVGSPDMKNYLKHTRMPRYNVTADAADPIVNCECAKHRPAFSMDWEKNDARPQVTYLQGGKSRNTIPGYSEALIAGLTAAEAKATAEANTARTEVAFELEDTEEGLRIRANGRGAHILLPQLSRSAQTALFELLAELPLADCPSTEAIRKLAKLFPYGDFAGTGLGLTVRDDVIGASSTNFTTCILTETGLNGQFDSRGPTNATPENYAHVIDRALRDAGFTVEDAEMDPAHYVPESDPIVTLAKELYKQTRGYDAACVYCFGGTYAHFIDGAIATGITAPGIDANLHKANEFLPLDDFEKVVEFYILLILSLCSENPF